MEVPLLLLGIVWVQTIPATAVPTIQFKLKGRQLPQDHPDYSMVAAVFLEVRLDNEFRKSVFLEPEFVILIALNCEVGN